MSTGESQGGPPRRVQRRPGRPPSIASGRSTVSAEVRRSSTPRDRLPAPPDVIVPARESFRDEFEREVHPPAPPRDGVATPDGVAMPRRGPSSRQLLRRALSSPGAARQAVLLREVLGPPVALRSDATDRPS